MKSVAITGMGIVTGLGRGLSAHRQALREGRTSLTPLTLFQCEGIPPSSVAQVDPLWLEPLSRAGRTQRLAYTAALDALAQSGQPVGHGLTAVGTTTGGVYESEQLYFKDREQGSSPERQMLRNHMLGTVVDRLGNSLKLSGERQTFSTACSSSANSIGYAAMRVASGTPWALAGGVDSLSRLTYAGFYSLKLLSAKGCRPFDQLRDGLCLGEAAAFILLEHEDSARKRNANILGYITGWGCAADAYHMTAPHPEGLGAISAMQQALKDAGKSPFDVDYVNAHGTATNANDAVENVALSSVFKERSPAISSTKGATGHTLGAAGAVEVVLSVLCMQMQLAPATLGLTQPIAGTSLQYVMKEPQNTRIRCVLSNSFGFGGNNAALVIEAPT